MSNWAEAEMKDGYLLALFKITFFLVGFVLCGFFL